MTRNEPPRGSSREPNLDSALEQFANGNASAERMRNMMPGAIKIALIAGLGLLSWISTYSGMLELIIANTGQLGLIYKIAIGFAVAMLMLMIIYILDTLFSPINWWVRSIYMLGYVFLTLISVGFGFGFYWKFLESTSEATRSAEAALSHVQGELQKGYTRLDQLQGTLDALTAMSLQKASDERRFGNTCPNSRPGDGPRRRLRDADAKNFAFVSQFIKTRSTTLKGEIDRLGSDITKVLSKDRSMIDAATGTRNTYLRELNRRLDLTVTRVNALQTDPQLAEYRQGLATRSEKTSFSDGGRTFVCPDAQLQTALRGVVKALNQLPTIKKQDIAAVEGSEAIVEAFRRLTTTTIGAIQFKLPPSPDELRKLQKQAIQSAGKTAPQTEALLKQEPGLGPRDYIPLFIALFVDFCILLVSINRPINRLQGLRTLVREAQDGPIAEILEKFHDTHLGGLSKEFEIFQHVVFDFLGDYYVAVPLSTPSIDARYLANLLVSLEGKGIVDRVMIPPAFVVRRKLAKQGSTYAEERLFRLYRFRSGAWSKLVLDAILGSDSAETPDPQGRGHDAKRTEEHDADVVALPAPNGPRRAGGKGPA